MKRENIKEAAQLDAKIEAISKVIDRLTDDRKCKKISLDFGGPNVNIELTSEEKINIVIDALVAEMQREIEGLNSKIEQL